MKHFAELSPAAERIVDAAEELVQHVGFNGFSYEDISQKVGIRKPSIHHHFQTKVELVVVMTQRYIHRFQMQLEEIESASTSSKERLRAYARLFAKTFENDRSFAYAACWVRRPTLYPRAFGPRWGSSSSSTPIGSNA